MKRVVMIGSAREVRGGISAMVEVCFAHGLFERWDAEYLATHCDGGRLRKAWQAARAAFALGARLAVGRVALLHVHIASGASFWRKALLLAPARALGVPYILHVHAGDFDAFHRRCGPLARRLLHSLYRGAEAVVALSDEWRATLQAAMPGLRVEVIPNPVAMPRLAAPLDASPPTVLFLGVLRAEKGVYELLRAWPAVLAADPRARLVLAGSGEGERARALAEELGVADSVVFPGWTGGEAKARLLRQAWLLALPSHFEALPMAVLEAMAAGVPVVASRVGGIPEALGTDAGVLVEPRDPAALAGAIGALLADAGRRKALGRAGRRRAAEHHAAAAVLPRIEALWQAVTPEAKRTIRPRAACP